ncbi:energy transducer TonB [uncultured Sphingomonas sp.]|uniref:energy transducer TonB n=1 Tax=uncultured Sphingomonas sp. TaxID=158754 RepID=UPI0025CC280B|nr:energy transducer TonB [uncultured Sphingomonas sp.]
MLFGIALLAMQSLDNAKVAQPLRPLTSPGSWVTDDDYPATAARQNHQGTVAFQLTIDSSGFPAGCSVTQSSGFEELDQQVCSLMVQRARFSPARDASGKAIAAPYKGRFTWRMQQDETVFRPGSNRAEFELSPDNVLRTCRVGDKVIETIGQSCGAMTIGNMAGNLAAYGTGKHRRLTMEQRSEIGGQHPLVYDMPGEVKIAKRAARFETDAAGTRVKCEETVETPGMSSSLSAPAPLCPGIPQSFAGQHLAPGGKDGPLSGSMVIATSWKELP